MFAFLWPVALIVGASVLYNIAAKSIPTGGSPYLSLVGPYLLAALLSLGCHFLFDPGRGLSVTALKMNWAMYALSVSMVGLEVGYIFMYRVGWKISLGSLVANILLSLALLLIGILFYKEKIDARQLIGIIVCMSGICILGYGKE